MNPAEIGFWLSAALVVYTYALYPLVLAALAKIRGRPPCRSGPLPASVSVVVAAHNEEEFIDERVNELTSAIAAAGLAGEVIVVSDGSTDATATLVRCHPGEGLRLLELPVNVGKAAALTEACALASHEIVVFADARQTWEPDALVRLLENFADPRVGAVGGDLVIERAPGVLAGVGTYWSYEKWLRQRESLVHSTVGVTGAICAVRRRLFRPVPPGTVLDDVYWPLGVVMQGYRVLHDSGARAFDRLPASPRDEFRRKVRTLSGNLQLLTRLPAALVPWRNPLWFQLVSHKLLRLAVPWALAAMFILSAFQPGPVYQALFWGQAAFYLLGLVGVCEGTHSRFWLFRDAAAFLVLNGAAWLAFWVWVFGRTDKSWAKISYRAAPLPSVRNPKAPGRPALVANSGGDPQPSGCPTPAG